MEKENEYVQMGNLIHKFRYKRAKKDIIIDNTISFDFIKRGNLLEVHDIKKSRKMENAHRWQLIYYLYYLHKHGVEAIGVLDYPLLNKKEVVEPKIEDFEKIEEVVKKIKDIISNKMPSPIKRKICKKCSYSEFCFGGDG